MALLSIKHIYDSDSITEVVAKTNFNFEQLFLNGGGPVGPPGISIEGLPGRTGRRGVMGDLGPQGSSFYAAPVEPVDGAPVLYDPFSPSTFSNPKIGDSAVSPTGKVYVFSELSVVTPNTGRWIFLYDLALALTSGSLFRELINNISQVYAISLDNTNPDPFYIRRGLMLGGDEEYFFISDKLVPLRLHLLHQQVGSAIDPALSQFSSHIELVNVIDNAGSLRPSDSLTSIRLLSGRTAGKWNYILSSYNVGNFSLNDFSSTDVLEIKNTTTNPLTFTTTRLQDQFVEILPDRGLLIQKINGYSNERDNFLVNWNGGNIWLLGNNVTSASHTLTLETRNVVVGDLGRPAAQDFPSGSQNSAFIHLTSSPSFTGNSIRQTANSYNILKRPGSGFFTMTFGGPSDSFFQASDNFIQISTSGSLGITSTLTTFLNSIQLRSSNTLGSVGTLTASPTEITSVVGSSSSAIRTTEVEAIVSGGRKIRLSSAESRLDYNVVNYLRFYDTGLGVIQADLTANTGLFNIQGRLQMSILNAGPNDFMRVTTTASSGNLLDKVIILNVTGTGTTAEFYMLRNGKPTIENFNAQGSVSEVFSTSLIQGNNTVIDISVNFNPATFGTTGNRRSYFGSQSEIGSHTYVLPTNGGTILTGRDFLGAFCDFAVRDESDIPEGWAPCYGQILNDPLSPYNGYVMPDCRGRVNVGNDPGFSSGRNSGTNFDFAGNVGGVNFQGLTPAQLPPHVHRMFSFRTDGYGLPEGAMISFPNEAAAYKKATEADIRYEILPGQSITQSIYAYTGDGTTNSANSGPQPNLQGQTHNNLQPYLVVIRCIRVRL